MSTWLERHYTVASESKIAGQILSVVLFLILTLAKGRYTYIYIAWCYMLMLYVNIFILWYLNDKLYCSLLCYAWICLVILYKAILHGCVWVKYVSNSISEPNKLSHFSHHQKRTLAGPGCYSHFEQKAGAGKWHFECRGHGHICHDGSMHHGKVK